jgi:hypothetical protein
VNDSCSSNLAAASSFTLPSARMQTFVISRSPAARYYCFICQQNFDPLVEVGEGDGT